MQPELVVDEKDGRPGFVMNLPVTHIPLQHQGFELDRQKNKRR
jgi:hypothetical protein